MLIKRWLYTAKAAWSRYGSKGADMTAEEYRAELELQYSVTELEYQQESGG